MIKLGEHAIYKAGTGGIVSFHSFYTKPWRHRSTVNASPLWGIRSGSAAHGIGPGSGLWRERVKWFRRRPYVAYRYRSYRYRRGQMMVEFVSWEGIGDPRDGWVKDHRRNRCRLYGDPEQETIGWEPR